MSSTGSRVDSPLHHVNPVFTTSDAVSSQIATVVATSGRIQCTMRWFQLKATMGIAATTVLFSSFAVPVGTHFHFGTCLV